MAGSIQIDTDALAASVAELQALHDNGVLTSALNAVSDTTPTQSSGKAAAAIKTYYDQLSLTTSAYSDLLLQTIAILNNANEYFTLTDEELAAYLASRA